MELDNPSGKSILVVDDDLAIRELFELLLRRHGFNVQTANNGEEAIKVLSSKIRKKFDLIILDLMMPNRSGYDALKELQEGLNRDIPIFIVTARALDRGTIEMIEQESNVRRFWSKPIDSRDFVEKVHEVLGTEPKKFFDEWKG